MSKELPRTKILDIDQSIALIKDIMVGVSTGITRIQDKNDEYNKLYKEISEYLEFNNLRNPNEFLSLWEFYAYWKKNLPSYADRRLYISQLYRDLKQIKLKLKNQNFSYVNKTRLEELVSIRNNGKFDLTKLIKYCEELNLAYDNESYLSTAMLVRSIIDHVPPIFNCSNFAQVTANSVRSLKESLMNLENSSRKIADSFLHLQIRSKEVLPNSNQVDFSNNLDVLLSEIFRILK